MSAAGAEVRELRKQVRAWRRGRANTRLVDALSDAYIAVFATLMLGSMLVNVIINVRTVTGTLCTSAACTHARELLPWVFTLSVVTACLGLSRLFGPMLVSPAVGSWLLTTPIDRAALLRPRLIGTGLVTFGVGGLLTAAGSTLAGFGVGAVAAFAVTVGAICLTTVGLACLAQASSSPLARVVTWFLAALVWIGLFLLALDAVPSGASEPQFGSAWVIALVASCVLAALAAVRALRVLHRMRRDQLTPGGSLVPGLSGALASLDFALVYDILVARHWLSRSTVRSVRGRGFGAEALVWREVIRLRRSPQTVIVLAGSLVLPYLAGTLGLGRLVVLVAASTGFFAGLGLFSALRVVSRTPSLVRCLPMEPWEVKAACAAVPALALMVWGLATTPVVHASIDLTWPAAVSVALAIGVTSAVAVTRWMTGKPPDYQLPLVTSPLGAVPTSLYVSAVRGFDVLLLGSAPLLIAPTPQGALISIALDGIVMTILLARR